MYQKAFLTLFLLASVATATPPPSLDIRQAAGKIQLTAKDRKNGSWILQTSEDMVHWTSKGSTLHVRNSVLPVSTYLPPVNQAASAYFRLVSSTSSYYRSAVNTLVFNSEVPNYSYSLWATPPPNLPSRIATATIDDKKAKLGRVLFYDRRLSLDNSVSCASCHQQEHAFATGAGLSTGHKGDLTKRNPISLQHVRSYIKGGMIFWDGRGQSIESAVLDPITHPDEMGLSIAEMIKKITAEPYYQDLFYDVYAQPGNARGQMSPTSPQVAECLGDFIEAMVTFRSKYDTGSVSNFSNFTSQESSGKSIFSSRCASCHPLGSFANGGFANNGLDLVYKDQGRALRTKLTSDEGKFRVPSLRQVELTAPYMHDGRFATLREVIDFYDHGVALHPNLTKPLTGLPMGLSESQKGNLEAFLKTLTDRSTLENQEFSDPFRTK